MVFFQFWGIKWFKVSVTPLNSWTTSAHIVIFARDVWKFASAEKKIHGATNFAVTRYAYVWLYCLRVKLNISEIYPLKDSLLSVEEPGSKLLCPRRLCPHKQTLSQILCMYWTLQARLCIFSYVHRGYVLKNKHLIKYYACNELYKQGYAFFVCPQKICPQK